MPTIKLSATEEMVKELVEIEEVLSCLDQHAGAAGPAPARAFSRWYDELVKLREDCLFDWNDDASCGLHDYRRMLYRCDEASKHYHTTDNDGPCEVYTPNYDGSSGKAVSVCDLHDQMALDAEDKLQGGRDEYLLAKQRGEDV